MELDCARTMQHSPQLPWLILLKTKPSKSIGPMHVQPNLWYTSCNGLSNLVNTIWVHLHECCVLD